MAFLVGKDEILLVELYHKIRFCDLHLGHKLVCTIYHDDVIKWKHFPRNWPFVRGIHRSPVNSRHKGQWHGALMFSLICVWINGWVNNREAGDLRCYRAHHDVIVIRCEGASVCTCAHMLINMQVILKLPYSNMYIYTDPFRIHIRTALSTYKTNNQTINTYVYTHILIHISMFKKACSYE